MATSLKPFGQLLYLAEQVHLHRLFHVTVSGQVPAHKAEKKDAAVAGDKCSSLWRVISHCIGYVLLAFFAVVVIYYVAMRAAAGPVLMPGLGK